MTINGGGYSMTEMEAGFLERAMLAPLTVSCARCSWSLSGPAGDVLREQAEHRAGHGVVRYARRRRGKFSQRLMTENEAADVLAEVERRKFLHGVTV